MKNCSEERRRGGKDGTETDRTSWAAESAAVEGGLPSRGAVEVGISIFGLFSTVFKQQKE